VRNHLYKNFKNCFCGQPLCRCHPHNLTVRICVHIHTLVIGTWVLWKFISKIPETCRGIWPGIQLHSLCSKTNRSWPGRRKMTSFWTGPGLILGGVSWFFSLWVRSSQISPVRAPIGQYGDFSMSHSPNRVSLFLGSARFVAGLR